MFTSDDVTLDFIRDIEKLNIIWDTKNPFYKLGKRNLEAWKTIAGKYKKTTGEVKRKWQSLQRSFRRERTKESKFEIGSRGKYKSIWFAYSAMDFLANHYRPSQSKDVSEASQISEDEEHILVVRDDERSSRGEEADKEPLHCVHSKSEDHKLVDNQMLFKMRKDKLLSSCNQQKIVNKRKSDVNVQDTQTVVQRAVRAESKVDECRLYGDYIVEKLRKLDNHSRSVAIHTINGTLFEAEMGQYKNSRLTSSFSRPRDSTQIIIENPQTKPSEEIILMKEEWFDSDLEEDLEYDSEKVSNEIYKAVEEQT